MFEKHPFAISAEQSQRLRQHLAIPEGTAAAAFDDEINRIATDYLVWKQQREADLSRPAARKQLRNLSHRASRLASDVASLSETAGWHLGCQFARLGDAPGAEQVFEATQQLHNLALAAERGFKSLQGGPEVGQDRPLRRNLEWAISELVALWEKATGLPPTHTRGEAGEPTSPCGVFLLTVFGLVDQKVLAQSLTTELDRICKKRRQGKPEQRKSAKQADSAV